MSTDFTSQTKDHFIPVLLNECSIDSPSFRASIYFLGNQLRAYSQWSEEFLCLCQKYIQAIESMEPIVASISFQTMPSIISCGFFDPDYATTALLHGQELFRSSFLVQLEQAKNIRKYIINPMELFHESRLRPLLQLDERYRTEQEHYDAEILRYASLGQLKDLAQMRDEAKSLYDARSTYFTIALQYVVQVGSFHSYMDSIALESISRFSIETFRLSSRLHESNISINNQIVRLLAYGNKLKESYPSLKKIITNVSNRVEKEILKRIQPPSNLDEYRIGTQKASNTMARKRQGWLLRNVSSTKPDNKAIWRKLWFFIDNGYFGYLTDNANGGVFESERIGVLLCKFSLLPNSNRRFCFQIKTKSSLYILQAENQNDMLDWGSVLHNSRIYCLNQKVPADLVLSPTLPSFSARSVAPTAGRRRNQSIPKNGKSARTHTHSEKLLCGQSNYEVSTIMRSKSLPSVPSPRDVLRSTGSHNRPDLLAPWSIVAAPIITSLTSDTITSFLDHEAFFTGNSPSALMANFWGSVNYGHVLEQQNLSLKSDFGLSYQKISREMDLESFPAELKLRNAEFKGIFGELGTSAVLFVSRVVSKREGQIRMPGRMYCTMRGVFIYYTICGLVLIEHIPISKISNIKYFTSSKCDYFYLSVEKFGTLRFRLYLDSSKILHDRLNILIYNYVADNPMNSVQLLSRIREVQKQYTFQKPRTDQSTIPDFDAVARPQTHFRGRSKTLSAPTGNVYVEDEHVTEQMRRLNIARLPKETVQVARSDHMDDIILDNIYDVSSKALFHIVFGDKSNFLLRLYRLHGIEDIELLPWIQDEETGKNYRYINYKLHYRDSKGVFHSQHYQDRQVQDKRNEYNVYILSWYHQPWAIPYKDCFRLVLKTSISHLKKNKCRLLLSIGIEWIKKPFAVSKVLEAVAREVALKYMELEVGYLEKAVLATKNLPILGVVNQYGKVGDYYESVVFQRKLPYISELRSPSMLKLIRDHIWLFLGGLAMDLSFLPWSILSSFLRYTFSHSFVMALLALSLIVNILLTFNFGENFWTERQDQQFLSRVFDDFKQLETSARYVYMKDVDDLLVGIPTYTHPNLTENGECLRSFINYSSQAKNHWLEKRNHIAEKRKFVLMKLASLNYFEYLVHQDAIYQHIQQELKTCQKAKVLGLYPLQIEKYCSSCEEEWQNRTSFFGENNLATRLISLDTQAFSKEPQKIYMD
ncbi:pleckstrin y domain-containing protein [Schizosaccharomyces cryophilus OY26]|uniref:Pleckstrin y domain-containing protein n=1 Tax=Schizosaccharomyces cryophilus (strain OY26 / ATCC MYA-4695 / CBS 11777 / NBRC 106824 / NRRL Y48691) TaxID=653667 RepID=S9W344_SCHCR|nr:pleckstrin y domain-containing protein [Schizosaccharomyces cryophilus OY26]EPY52365.1 pleckstrin y domain-containing protein [Schizosaccharomyces cryophilus OY26]